MGAVEQVNLQGKPETVEVSDLPREASLSAYLSLGGAAWEISRCASILTLASTQLESVHLVLLALNEECRAISRGAFYHLPIRTDKHEAHPCDLIYLPDTWNNHDRSSWDKASWARRLEMCRMEGRIEVDEDVLPLCVRILQVTVDASGTTGKSRPDSGYDSIPDTSASDSPLFSAADPTVSPINSASTSRPTAQYDPAVAHNSYKYSRPMEDISSYLVLYTSHHSTPLLCPTAAFEHHSHCDRYPTPGDYSETFHYGPGSQKAETRKISTSAEMKRERAKQDIAKQARQEVAMSGMSSNRELVERIWDIWHGNFQRRASGGRDWMGRVKYSWQEVKSIIDDGRHGFEGLPLGWPERE